VASRLGKSTYNTKSYLEETRVTDDIISRNYSEFN